MVDFLQNGADVNVINDVGDTALHRAAFTGRVVRTQHTGVFGRRGAVWGSVLCWLGHGGRGGAGRGGAGRGGAGRGGAGPDKARSGVRCGRVGWGEGATGAGRGRTPRRCIMAACT